MWIVSMSSHVKCLLLVVMVVAMSSSTVRADKKTYICNQSSLLVDATMSYTLGTSEFVNRIIEVGTCQSDTYNSLVPWVSIEIWLDGSVTHQKINIDPDRSIVAYDNVELGFGYVDIFLAKMGTLIQKDGGVLTTIAL